MRRLLFGDCPIDDWPPRDEVDGEPWRAFIAARGALHAGDADTAAQTWASIAAQADLEPRHTLQAWYFLRGRGVEPPADVAKRVLGAVAEVAVSGGHDVLAAYADDSVRYLNVTGAAVVVEQPLAGVGEAVRRLLDVAQVVAEQIGPWDQPVLPPLPVGFTRITMLTPSGPHFGQGPDEQFRQDPMAGVFLSAATELLVAVMRHAQP